MKHGTFSKMTETTDRCESIFPIAIFLHLPSGCPNANPVLSTQESPAARRSTKAFLCFFAVNKDSLKLKSLQLSISHNITNEQFYNNIFIFKLK